MGSHELWEALSRMGQRQEMGRRGRGRGHGGPLLLTAATTPNPGVASFEKPVTQSVGRERPLPEVKEIRVTRNVQVKPVVGHPRESRAGEILKTIGMGVWSLAAAGLFRHSFQRCSELLTFNTDGVLASDLIMTALAWATCPFDEVKYLGHNKTGRSVGLVTAAVVGAHSAFNRKRRLRKLAKQAVRVPGDEAVWRNALCPGGEVASHTHTDIQTLYHNFFKLAALAYPDRPCLGRRTADGFDWISYNEVSDISKNFGAGLRTLDVEPKAKIGVYSVNKVEWFMAELGCYTQNMIVVALYSTLGEDAVAYVVEHSEMAAAVVSLEALPSLLAVLKKTPKLKYIIYIDEPGSAPPKEEQKAKAKASGIQMFAFSEIVERGAASTFPPTVPDPQDLSTIMYTSGTTGNPKGVLLTHANVIANGTIYPIVIREPMREGDRYLSYLPLAHILERACVATLFSGGVAIGVFGGKTEGLVDDIAALKPTVLAGVPRVYNRIHERVVGKVQEGSKLKQFLFHAALSETDRLRKAGGALGTIPLWDKLIFSKIKARLGGECRLLLSGGAPLSDSTQTFLTAAFGCPAIQGYGLTETTAAGGMGDPLDAHSGHVGAVVPCLELKLEDCADMGYTTADKPSPRGEICFRGPAVMQGYYKEPKMTAEVMDADGWFHTGDIGKVNVNGTLAIIDRKKNIFKLSQGEYVAAEKLEIAYQQSKYVAQIFVYGDSLQSCLVAVVVPDMDALRSWAKGAAPKIANASDASLCASPDAAAEVLKNLKATAKQPPALKGFEIVRAVYLDPEPFAVENNLLTPTFKNKRPQLKEKYHGEIQKLYSQMKA